MQVKIFTVCFISFTGYARIILAIVAFLFMPTNYIIASWCYVVSALLDAFDGYFARKLNQGNTYSLIFPK